MCTCCCLFVSIFVCMYVCPRTCVCVSASVCSIFKFLSERNVETVPNSDIYIPGKGDITIKDDATFLLISGKHHFQLAINSQLVFLYNISSWKRCLPAAKRTVIMSFLNRLPIHYGDTNIIVRYCYCISVAKTI